MERHKKSGVYPTLLLFLFLYGVLLSSPAQAGVQLMGWSNLNPGITPDGTDTNKGTYQYVLFGKYDSKPIVWRILSADQTGTARKGYLYSEKALGDDVLFDTGGFNNYGTSSIRAYLVGTGVSEFYKNDNFTVKEKSAVVVQTFITQKGYTSDTPVTTMDNAMFLPSSDDLLEPAYGFAVSSALQDVNRMAVDTSGNMVAYWTRSPTLLLDTDAQVVDTTGDLAGQNVGAGGYYARPACFLNLESLVFKSASNDFDLGSPSAAEGGSILNPYVLVLPNAVPTSAPSGWTTTFISVNKAPVRATINAKTLIVEWNTAISPAVKNWPVSTDFVLSTGQSPISVASAPNNNAIQLTFSDDVAPSGLTLSYNLNTDAIVFAKSGTQASVVNSFANLAVKPYVEPVDPPVTPGVTPTQVRFNGLAPADVKVLLSGSALSAANAGTLRITVDTPSGTRIPLGSGDYSVESRNLTILISFLSKLGDGTHTLYFYNGDVQVGKITLTVTNSTGGDITKDSGSSGCNAGLGSAGLLAMGIVLLGLNKAGARKKK